ncbi:MAG: hypothetical protein E7524_05340 [Ruminococcaceae bacterium]|nr:hypothetical protein [Oscillospiraceae bacterium]
MKKLLSIFTILAVILSCVATVLPTALAADGEAFTNLYNEDYYTVRHNKTTGKITFNSEKGTMLTTDNQSKAMINYSTDMTTFDASINVMGNDLSDSPNYGLIYGGLFFHADANDFNKSTFSFNTTGYSAIIKRSASSLGSATLMIRYVSNNSNKKELTTNFTVPAQQKLVLKLELSVTDTEFTAKVKSADGATEYASKTYPLDNTASYPATAAYYSGGLGFLSNGRHTYSNFNVTSYDDSVTIPPEEGAATPPPAPTDPLADKYNVFGTVNTDADNFTATETAISRVLLKNTENTTDFSADLVLKTDASAGLKSGIIFRVKSAGTSTDDMQGYSLIAQKMTSGEDKGKIRLYLYKYGEYNGANAYLGRIAYVAQDFGTVTANQEFTVHINVVGERIEAYCYETANPSLKSELLKASLKDATESAKNNPNIYYEKGSVGAYIATGSVKAVDFKVNEAETMSPEPIIPATGTPATDDKIGSAVKGGSTVVSNVNESNITAPTVDDLESYAADFDNYTYYSSSTSNKLLRTEDGLTSTTTGAKRAILDGVTVKGFHAAVTMKISEEGTLRSGMVFRVNNIEKSLEENGTLPANNIQGYAAILYKTKGTTESHARVVICIYKYGYKKGKYQYLGTVASKASEVPLKGFEKDQFASAGQELTLDVNVIDDELTAYYYNANNPSLVSEKLVTKLTAETDIEKGTPSLKGIHYESGAIGLTATDYVTFTNFTVSEPVYPSNEIGSLSSLDSYTIYGSGVKQEGEYITANTSGTKKLIVNNLTVKDFTASVDMTIDNNGNLKSGFFFRVNEVGNGADDQTGWAIIVTRNYATNGDNNPNRIDIVLFKWGYSNGKLSYLGEVAREVYKSGASFMDGKMAGEELTFVVQVKGAAIDASLYHKANPKNKPVTFSTNLKFAASKEKGDVAYWEAGGIGLYLGNSVSDPLNYNRVRNFHINDGSGVLVKNTKAGGLAKLKGVLPITGEGALITVVAMLFVIALGALVALYVYNKKGKRENTGDSIL